MSERIRYECGTCGNHNLVARAVSDVNGVIVWMLFCGKGHPFLPVDGREILITGETR